MFEVFIFRLRLHSMVAALVVYLLFVVLMVEFDLLAYCGSNSVVA